MSYLRSTLESLSLSDLRKLIEEIEDCSEGEMLHSRSGKEVFRTYLNELSREDLRTLIECANDLFDEQFQVSGSKENLVNRLIDGLRPSDLVECLDDCELNGLVTCIDQTGTKGEIIDRILEEAEQSRVVEALENLGYDLEEDEDGEWDEDYDEESARLVRRRRPQLAPLRYDPDQAARSPTRPYQRQALAELRARYAKPRSVTRGYLYVATGGGKTHIANEFVVQDYILKGKRVVWLTHNPYLLYQAASELCARFGNLIGEPQDVLATFGSERNGWLLNRVLSSYRDREFNSPPLLLYCTQASLQSALKDGRGADARRLRDFDPELVVIDEAHWGKSGSIEEDLYNKLFDGVWADQNILGLSATPKVRKARGWLKKHVGNVAFSDLVGKTYLSRPVEVRLAIDVGTTIRARDGLITNYTEIARDDARNKAIVRHYQANRAKYGKTMFFAINREHANSLGDLLRGETALVIHGGRSGAHASLDEFRHGPCDVAVVVNMAKEGVDIPELRTVVLCKPVTSQIEFAQMVGRASRRTEGKSHFYIVDCYDTLANPEMEAILYHFQDYFKGASDRDEVSPRSERAAEPRLRNKGVRTEHSHDPLVGLQIIQIPQGSEAPADPSLQLLHGLRMSPSQTFGIELEFAPSGNVDIFDEDEWLPAARSLAAALKKAVGPELVHRVSMDGEADHSKWSVVHDGSCGWELVSPKLMGQDGFEQVLAVLTTLEDEDTLRSSGLRVDVSTGFHVHLGWRYGQPKKVRRTLQFIRMIEPALFSLVAPSRVVSPDGSGNEYCESIRKRFSDSKLRSLNSDSDLMNYFGSYDDRYRLINLTKYDESAATSTAEIRLHNGTADPAKVTLWIALWMNILSSLDHFDLPEVMDFSCKPEIALPSGDELSDIVWVCHRFLSMETKTCMPFLERLHRRRRECFGSDYWRTEMRKRRIEADAVLTQWEERFREVCDRLG